MAPLRGSAAARPAAALVVDEARVGAPARHPVARRAVTARGPASVAVSLLEAVRARDGAVKPLGPPPAPDARTAAATGSARAALPEAAPAIATAEMTTSEGEGRAKARGPAGAVQAAPRLALGVTGRGSSVAHLIKVEAKMAVRLPAPAFGGEAPTKAPTAPVGEKPVSGRARRAGPPSTRAARQAAEATEDTPLHRPDPGATDEPGPRR